MTTSIPFNRARFCSNCENITEILQQAKGQSRCPVCNSESWVPLSRWLDREPTKAERQEIDALMRESLEISPLTMVQLAELFGLKKEGL